MENKRLLTLSHDWDIFRAKYIADAEFENHENDFMALCELGCIEALSIYTSISGIEYDKKIYEMLSRIPDDSPQDVQNKMLIGKATMEDYYYSILKRNFNGRDDIPEEYTGDYLMCQLVITQAQKVGKQTNESFKSLLQAETPDEGKDNLYIEYLSSIIVNGQRLSPESKWALMAIANQPYSDIMQNKLAEKSGAEEM